MGVKIYWIKEKDELKFFEYLQSKGIFAEFYFNPGQETVVIIEN